MFPEPLGQYVLSLLPASQFPQKKVGVMARAMDVVHDYRTAHFAGVIDNDVAKAHQALGNARRNRHVLHFTQGYVLGGAGDETGINLKF